MEIGWIPIVQRQPEKPGQYLTRRDVEVNEDRHGLRKIRAVILEGRYNGEHWEMQLQPTHWRDLPIR